MNGNGENGGNVERRLTRLEEFVEVLTSEHIQFAEEHKRLLTAQVVLTDRMDKLAEAQERTEAHLDLLTRTMDAWIRRNDRQ